MSAEINSTDTIFATVIRNGITLLSTRLIGMNSIAEVIARLRSMLGAAAGLLRLRLRNATCGWSSDQSIILS